VVEPRLSCPLTMSPCPTGDSCRAAGQCIEAWNAGAYRPVSVGAVACAADPVSKPHEQITLADWRRKIANSVMKHPVY
jgi:hypothetical protein